MKEPSNFVGPNEWPIRTLIIVILSLQIALWGLVGLDTLGVTIPILRQFIGVILLLLAPGILFVRSLKLRGIGHTETFVLSVGLSVFLLMMVGYLINATYPLFGISEPLSFVPLITTICLGLDFWLVLLYVVEKIRTDGSILRPVSKKQNVATVNALNQGQHRSLVHFLVREVVSLRALGLLLLPMLAVLGTYSMNNYSSNILLLILLCIVSIIPILISLNLFEEEFYPYIVFVVAISLLFHRSLISMNLWGADTFEELLCAKTIFTACFWDTSINWNLNAVLSVTILPSVFANVCGLDLVWVFKIIYPLLYAIVPLVIYLVIRDQMSSKVALYSVFFYMSVGEFYGVTVVIMRQIVALLFFGLLIFTIMNPNYNKFVKTVLFIVFSLGLIVSHYALSYIFLICFGAVCMIYLLLNNAQAPIKLYKSREKRSGYKDNTKLPQESAIYRISLLVLYVILTVVWYTYTSNSSAIVTIVEIIDLINSSIINDFLNPSATEGLAMLGAGTSSSLYLILKVFYLVSQLFISLGILMASLVLVTSLLRINFLEPYLQRVSKDVRFGSRNFVIFSICIYCFLMSALLLPFMSGNIGSIRLLHMVLIVLCPYFTIGIVIALNFSSHLVYQIIRKKVYLNYEYFVSIFICIFLLLNSGLIGEVVRDSNPNSIAISSDENYRNANLFSQKDLFGAQFLSNIYGDSDINVDVFGRQILRGFIFPKTHIVTIKEENMSDIKSNFLYFKSHNLNGQAHIIPLGRLQTVERTYRTVDIMQTELLSIVTGKNLIYSNGGSEVLL